MNSTSVQPILFAVETIEGAAPSVVDFGVSYWDLDTFDLNGRPIWNKRVSEITTDEPGPAYAVAAQGVRAVVDGVRCPHCSDELTLTSRAAYERLLANELSPCTTCDTQLQDHLARAANRLSKKPRLPRQQDPRREAIAARYPLLFEPERDVPEAPLRSEIVVLTLLRHSPNVSPISPLSEWPVSLSPGDDQIDMTGIGDAWRAGLIRVHPDSALSAIEFDDEGVPGNAIYPALASWYVPYGSSFETAVQNTVGVLLQRTSPAQLSRTRRDDFLKIAADLVADEALRYFAYWLDRLNLPEPPDHHRDRVREVLVTFARQFSLGQLYNLVWKATHQAASQAQQTPQARRVNMTTYAVNRLESLVNEAPSASEPPRPYMAHSDLDLCPMTRTVYYEILNRDPFQTSLDEVAEDLGWNNTRNVRDALPLLLCEICAAPSKPEDLWAWVDVRVARDHAQYSQDAPDWDINYPTPIARWGIAHSKCAPDEGALYDMELPTTYRDLLRFTAEALKKRSWILHTDIQLLLMEAATLSGRFEPHED